MNHPRRKLGVGIVAAAICAVFGLPAWDDVSAAQSREQKLATELVTVTNSVENLDRLKDRVELISLSGGESESVTAETAVKIRQSVVETIRKHRCSLKRIAISDPLSRPWGRDDDPLSGSAPKKEDATDLQLVTRRLTVVVGGPLPRLSRVIEESSAVHPLAVPTKMTIRRQGEDADLSLELELTLLRLERVATKKR